MSSISMNSFVFQHQNQSIVVLVPMLLLSWMVRTLWYWIPCWSYFILYSTVTSIERAVKPGCVVAVVGQCLYMYSEFISIQCAYMMNSSPKLQLDMLKKVIVSMSCMITRNIMSVHLTRLVEYIQYLCCVNQVGALPHYNVNCNKSA